MPFGFVILGRSKERSDAAQTLESMPLHQGAAAFQNSARCALRQWSRHGSSGQARGRRKPDGRPLLRSCGEKGAPPVNP
ncbi:hypothetical protein EOA75_19105 [Mesorhizobium sp. M1A.F.Ca.IN.022.07.1.1]|nr:hypothetical protein EJ078_28880 [Mesorhizobium sp. M1A.F.Ca.IN.022.06.1.1]RUV61794.1 hypothetical protein EOA64_14045 [Mesorhizobium sp. M1A.F.Ca.IN.022.02.1.1]RUV69492.1 hypothetical protein EOA50_26285 [Mesorhizobium sp. M1A.F.Ca.IN.020.30.1.1]RUV91614.1 hypothetical protein EOA75_19105 [Mesorhizobium sp. M1A.F.Ca.IN.022.07.1.1]RUV99512.1 hypothetical protein EOA49_19455 [Mesorhizobium sp. M1A.F.Ca.IN.020.04.1.1]RUW09160.1 hypothetical protein EOA53_17230 [Mesorhizobium sp. M1A.F.Ca.IN.0